MSINFLIEEMVDRENVPRICESIRKVGHRFETCKYIPFESGTYNQFKDDECVVFFGSLGLARQLMRTKPWVPGPFCNLNNFKCSAYYAYWYKYLWNDQHIFLPYAVFKSQINQIVDYFGYSADAWSLFIRPDDGFKTFTGQVIDSQSYNSDIKYLDSKCKPETLCVIAPCKTPLAEWRVFCKDRTIICGSQYRVAGKIDTEEIEGIPVKCEAYLQSVLNEVQWIPERLYVVDIAAGISKPEFKLGKQWKFEDFEYGVLELNSFSCSGMYKCDVNKIVAAAATVAKEEFDEINNQ